MSWIRNEWIEGHDGQWTQDKQRLCIVDLGIGNDFTKSIREIQNRSEHDHYQWFYWENLIIAIPGKPNNYLITWHKWEVS